MKHLILICGLLVAGNCGAQILALPYDSITGRINYKQITEVPNGKQDQVFTNAWRWLQKKYGPAVDTILVMDKEHGRIVVHATVNQALTLKGTEHKAYLEHLVTINAKDNKCLVQISDLKFKEHFDATEFSSAGWKEVPLEGVVLGVMNGRFGEANSKAYVKFLISEDISIKAIMDSFDAFVFDADALQATRDK